MNICKIDECTTAVKSRGLCQPHYYRLKRAGTLEEIGDPLTTSNNHYLSGINDTARTATCTVCGLTKIFKLYVDKGKQRWGCTNKHRTFKAKQPKYYYADGQKFIDPTFAESERIRLTLEQDGCCALCDSPETFDDMLRLDHCHTTGEIRGMLCNNCNIGLGWFKDNSDSLRKAAEYVA